MIPDQDLLEKFEEGLDTRSLDRSKISATLIGYGEISAIFQMDDDPAVAYKRMPLFNDTTRAREYATMYDDYCDLLTRAGLTLVSYYSPAAGFETEGHRAAAVVGCGCSRGRVIWIFHQ